MNIFITGGSGFIGRNFRELLGKKYNILAPSHQELELLDGEAVRNYIKNHKIDVIIHVANKGGGRDTTDMMNVVEYNTRMFFNITRNSHFVKKIIFFGSGAEYGKQRDLIKVKEDDFDKYVPSDDYGFTKYICSKYIEKSNNIISLRLFGVYGKYENYRYKFISNAIVKNLFSLPITINQNVYFDYLYIDDLIKIIEYFINSESRYNIYNCTRGETVDLISLANIINEVSDNPSEIIVLNEGLNKEYSGDNSRLLDELGKFKFTSHKDAIKYLYSFYKSIINKIDRKEIEEDRYIKYCRVGKND